MNQENSVEIFEEGYRNFDLKPLIEEEERFIKKLVDMVLVEAAPKSIVTGGEFLDFKGRGQRRKLQLYGDKGERES